MNFLRSTNFSLFLSLLIVGCVSIPKESVDLNNVVAQGIQENHRVQINLLNKYFEQKKNDLNNLIINEYLPKLISNFQSSLKKNGMDTTLDSPKIEAILKLVMTKLDAANRELDKTKVLIQDKIDTNYQLIIQANSSLTNLLQSAANVSLAQSNFNSTIKSMTSESIDLNAIDKSISGYIVSVGNDAKSAVDVYENVKNIISNNK